MKQIQSRVWLEVDVENLEKNFNTIKERVGNAMIMAVLKADAYGLGVEKIAMVLENAGVSRFGVAEINEALTIRKFSKLPIHILSGILDSEIEPALDSNIILPVNSFRVAEKISTLAGRKRITATVHILVDTGMGRLGLVYDREDTVKEIKKILNLPDLYIEGIYTHYAVANVPSDSYTNNQLKKFKDILKHFPNTFDIIHTANSDAINNFPDTYFDMVRTGINLYGVFDLQGRRIYSLSPVISLKSRIMDIRRLKKGSGISYGCEYILKRDSNIATVCAGYADGIPSALGNKGKVLINEKVFSIRGRIAMDYFMVDLGDNKDINIEDDVVIIGKSGKYEITVEDVARVKGTHPYDIICSISPRVKRVYI